MYSTNKDYEELLQKMEKCIKENDWTLFGIYYKALCRSIRLELYVSRDIKSCYLRFKILGLPLIIDK